MSERSGSRTYSFAVFFLAVATFLCGCRPDENIARWDVEALTPILSSRLELADMIEDSTLATREDGQLSLVYRNRLSSFKFERILQPFNKTFANVVKLDDIKIGNRSITSRVSLGYIARKSGITGAFIIANNGTQNSMPEIKGVGPERFILDATDYFQSVTLSDGKLIVSLYNGFPVELTDITYAVENQSGGNPIIAGNIPTIPPFSTFMDSVELTGGITIEGQIRAVLQSFNSGNNNNNPVRIDTSDVLELTIVIKDLDPVAATAVFPDQDLLDLTEETEIEDFNGQLTSIHVKSGKLFMDAKSTIEDEVIFHYRIPGAVYQGQPMDFTATVPPASTGGTSTTYIEEDLGNYDVDLTGIPGSFGVFNTFYSITEGRIDSSGHLIHLSQDDSVSLRTGILDLLADRGYGYLGQDTLEINESSAIDLFREFRDGELLFEEADLSLEIENYIGAPLSVIFNSLYSETGSGERKSLVWDQLNEDINIDRATEGTPGQKPVPGIELISLNKNNSNIAELFSIRPRLMETELKAYINPGNAPDHEQFVYLDHGLETFLSIDIPLHLSMKDILFRDTASFHYESLDPSGRFQSGELYLIGDNNFPLEISVDVILLDDKGAPVHVLTSPDLLASGKVNAVGRVVEKVKSRMKFPVTGDDINLLKKTAAMVFEARFTTPDQARKFRIYSDSYLDITLAGNLKLRTGK